MPRPVSSADTTSELELACARLANWRIGCGDADASTLVPEILRLLPGSMITQRILVDGVLRSGHPAAMAAILSCTPPDTWARFLVAHPDSGLSLERARTTPLESFEILKRRGMGPAVARALAGALLLRNTPETLGMIDSADALPPAEITRMALGGVLSPLEGSANAPVHPTLTGPLITGARALLSDDRAHVDWLVWRFLRAGTWRWPCAFHALGWTPDAGAETPRLDRAPEAVAAFVRLVRSSHGRLHLTELLPAPHDILTGTDAPDLRATAAGAA